jgi:hypothetical protein
MRHLPTALGALGVACLFAAAITSTPTAITGLDLLAYAVAAVWAVLVDRGDRAPTEEGLGERLW